MTDQHAAADDDGGPSGYTPLDELRGGGIAGGEPSTVSSVLMMASSTSASSGAPEEEAYPPGAAAPFPAPAAATFILAPSTKHDVEPEGWSDYSDDDDYGEAKGPMGEGAFFADMSAFPNPNEEEDAQQQQQQEEEEEEAAVPNGSAPLSMSGGADDDDDSDQDKDEDFDFRAIADQALRALDDEYLSTLQEQEVPAVAEDINVADQDDDSGNGVDDVSDNSKGRDNGEEEGHENPTPAMDAEDGSPLPPSRAKELPPIDNEAVRKAMEAMRLKSPDLANTLDAGAEQRLDAKYRLSLAPTLVPDVHCIIPPAPLRAFRKMTSKAVAASANLSRSATISEALVRCVPHLLLPQQDVKGAKKSNLVIHIIGSDHIECQTEETVRAAVGPLVRWIESACSSNVSSIDIELSGPNVPVAAERRGLTHLSSSSGCGLQSATARCIKCVYHDYLQSEECRTPDLVIAFDAGIWGYDEWRPTLEAMCNHESTIPFVITGYTVQEAEDDAEVVAEVAANAKACCLWSAEINPFGSRKKRETNSAARGREYRENGAWQAWRLGGTCSD